MVDEAILLSRRSLLSVGVEDRITPESIRVGAFQEMDQLFAFKYHIELNGGAYGAQPHHPFELSAWQMRLPCPFPSERITSWVLNCEGFSTLQASGGPSHLVQEDSERLRSKSYT